MHRVSQWWKQKHTLTTEKYMNTEKNLYRHHNLAVVRCLVITITPNNFLFNVTSKINIRSSQAPMVALMSDRYTLRTAQLHSDRDFTHRRLWVPFICVFFSLSTFSSQREFSVINSTTVEYVNASWPYRFMPPCTSMQWRLRDLLTGGMTGVATFKVRKTMHTAHHYTLPIIAKRLCCCQLLGYCAVMIIFNSP